MSSGGKTGMLGQTSNFIDPSPYVDYEKGEGALGVMAGEASSGTGGSTMAAQKLAGNDQQSAATMWQALAGEQGNQISQEATLQNYTNQSNALAGQDSATLAGLIGGL